MKLRITTLLVSLLLFSSFALAHLTPPVVLEKETQAVATFMADAQQQNFVLTKDEINTLKEKGWKLGSHSFRVYSGANGNTAIFMTDYTLHGSIRIGVAFDGAGKTMGVRIMEVSEESYNWVKPLMAGDFLQKLADTGKATKDAGYSKMTAYYADTLEREVEKISWVDEILKTRTK